MAAVLLTKPLSLGGSSQLLSCRIILVNCIGYLSMPRNSVTMQMGLLKMISMLNGCKIPKQRNK